MGTWLFGCDDLLKWDCEAGCEKGAASIEFILECESGNACSNRGTCTLKALNGSNDDSNDDDDCDDVIINGLAWVDSGNCGFAGGAGGGGGGSSIVRAGKQGVSVYNGFDIDEEV